MRETEQGELERVSDADLAGLERDRLQAQAQYVRRQSGFPHRSGPTPYPEGEPPSMPEFSLDLPRYQVPKITVDLSGQSAVLAGHIVVSAHHNRFDVAGAHRQGRDAAAAALAEAQQRFQASDAFAEEQRVRQRLGAAQLRFTQTEAAVAEAERQHHLAAAEGGDAGKAWKAVLKARDSKDEAQSALAAVEVAMETAKVSSRREQARLLEETFASQRQEIAARRKQLEEELLIMLKPVIEEMQSLSERASDLARRARQQPARPAA